MIDATERELLATTVARALESASGPAAADAALADLEWHDLLATEPADALDIVFTALGLTDRTATALDDVVLDALGFDPRPDLAVVLPPFGAWTPPGRIAAEQCRAAGLATARAAGATELLVVCGAGRDVCAVTVPRSSVAVRAVAGVDPDGGWQVVDAEHRVVIETRFDGAVWDRAVAAGRRAVAHQIAGACTAMLALARTHALERVQFSRPIASFQAVRHRLADALVAIEALNATLGVAAETPDDPLTAALAKATAGRTARVVATSCQQVLAGMGFTTDHPFHRSLKRTMLLEGLFGSADAIAVDLGQHLLATRQVPTVIDL